MPFFRLSLETTHSIKLSNSLVCLGDNAQTARRMKDQDASSELCGCTSRLQRCTETAVFEIL